MLGQGPSVCAGVCLCVVAACAGGAVAAEGRHNWNDFSGSDILRTLGYYPKDGGAAAKLVESLGFGLVDIHDKSFAKRQFWAVQVCDAQDQGARRTSVSPFAHTMTFQVFADATDGGDVRVNATLDGGNLSSLPLRWLLKLGRRAPVTKSFAVNTTEYTLGGGLTVRDQRFVCEDAHAAWLRRFGNMTYDCDTGHTVVLEYPAGCPRKGDFGRRDSTCQPRMVFTSPWGGLIADGRAANPFLRRGLGGTPVTIGYSIIDSQDSRYRWAFDVPIRDMLRGLLIWSTGKGVTACMSRAQGEFQTASHTKAMIRLLDSIEKKTFRCKFSGWTASQGSSSDPQQTRSFAVHFASSQPLTVTVNKQRVEVKSADNFSTPELILWWAPQGKDALYVFSARLEQVDGGEAVTVRMEGIAGWQIGVSTRFHYSGTRNRYDPYRGYTITEQYMQDTDMLPRDFCAQQTSGCLNTAACEQVMQVHVIPPDVPESDPADLDTGDRVTAVAQAEADAGDARRPETAPSPRPETAPSPRSETAPAPRPETAPAPTSSPSWPSWVPIVIVILLGFGMLWITLCKRVANRKGVRSLLLGRMPPQLLALSDGLAVHLTDADGEVGRESADRATTPPVEVQLL